MAEISEIFLAITARQEPSEAGADNTDPAPQMPVFTDDPAPTVNASIWTMTIVATLFLVARVYCKVFRTRGMWWDDYILIAGWSTLLANTGVITELMRVGFGMTLDIIPRNHTLTTTADVLNKISLGLTKTSFAITLLRVAQGWQRWFIWALVASMNALLLANCVTTWKPACGRPGDSYEVSLPPPCWAVELMAIMAVICNGYSAIVDFCLALLPWKILWTLQMKRHEKIGAAVGMSLGLVAGAIGVVKVVNILTVATATNIPYRLSIIFIWGQAEPNVTIIAASIPVLRVLFRDMHRSKDGGMSGDGPGTSLWSSKAKPPSASRTTRTRAGGDRGVPGDDDSQRSIIGESPDKQSIVRTTEVVMEYEAARKNAEGQQEDLEMDFMVPSKRKSGYGRAF